MGDLTRVEKHHGLAQLFVVRLEVPEGLGHATGLGVLDDVVNEVDGLDTEVVPRAPEVLLPEGEHVLLRAVNEHHGLTTLRLQGDGRGQDPFFDRLRFHLLIFLRFLLLFSSRGDLS